MKKKHKWKPRKAKPIHPNTRLLSIDQAALYYGCSPNTMRRMVNAKQLPPIMLRSSGSKRLIRVSKEALDEWIASEEKRGAR